MHGCGTGCQAGDDKASIFCKGIIATADLHCQSILYDDADSLMKSRRQPLRRRSSITAQGEYEGCRNKGDITEMRNLFSIYKEEGEDDGEEKDGERGVEESKPSDSFRSSRRSSRLVGVRHSISLSLDRLTVVMVSIVSPTNAARRRRNFALSMRAQDDVEKTSTYNAFHRPP